MKYLTINNIDKLQGMVSEQRYRVNPYSDVDSVEDTFEVIYVTERGDAITPIYVIRLEGKNEQTGMWFWVYREIKDGTVRVQKEYDFINTQGINTTETTSVGLKIDAFNQPDRLLVILKRMIWRPV
jgi:hypothetical protein